MGLENANISRREALKFIGGSALTVMLGGCGKEEPTSTLSPEKSAKIKADSQVVSPEANEIDNVFSEGVISEFKAEGSLDYPTLIAPDPKREPVFPDVAKGDRKPLAAYETPFEDGDYFQDSKGDIDVPQYYYRVMTAGEIEVPELGVNLHSTDTIGSLSIIINHFGETAMFRDATVDNGFTVAGRVFDMSTPEKVTEAAQALLDHYVGRVTGSEDGANCGTISACDGVQWSVSIVGNDTLQTTFNGVYKKIK